MLHKLLVLPLAAGFLGAVYGFVHAFLGLVKGEHYSNLKDAASLVLKKSNTDYFLTTNPKLVESAKAFTELDNAIQSTLENPIVSKVVIPFHNKVDSTLTPIASSFSEAFQISPSFVYYCMVVLAVFICLIMPILVYKAFFYFSRYYNKDYIIASCIIATLFFTILLYAFFSSSGTADVNHINSFPPSYFFPFSPGSSSFNPSYIYNIPSSYVSSFWRFVVDHNSSSLILLVPILFSFDFTIYALRGLIFGFQKIKNFIIAHFTLQDALVLAAFSLLTAVLFCNHQFLSPHYWINLYYDTLYDVINTHNGGITPLSSVADLNNASDEGITLLPPSDDAACTTSSAPGSGPYFELKLSIGLTTCIILWGGICFFLVQSSAPISTLEVLSK